MGTPLRFNEGLWDATVFEYNDGNNVGSLMLGAYDGLRLKVLTGLDPGSREVGCTEVPMFGMDDCFTDGAREGRDV